MESYSDNPNKESTPHFEDRLRERAERALEAKREDGADVARQDYTTLLHELRVHHVELEMQNDELREAQDSLAEACDHYAQLYDFSPAGYVTLSPEGLIEGANLRFCGMVRVPRQSVLRQPFSAFVAPQDWDAEARHRADVLCRETTQTCKLRLLPKEGPPLVAHVESVQTKSLGANATVVQMAILDITQRERAEALIQVSQGQLQRTAAKLLTAQDEERRRIARDLHDDYCQRLTAVILDIGVLLKRQPGPWAEPREHLQPLREKLSGLLKDLRVLSHELHPEPVTSVALDEALRRYVTDFGEKMAIAVTFHAPSDLQVPPPLSTCLYRVAQESLANIGKHAQCRQVMVSLTTLPTGIELLIKDDGQGFVKEAVDHSPHLGLTSMRERVTQLGGSLTISSQPGAGTIVSAQIPFGHSS